MPQSSNAQRIEEPVAIAQRPAFGGGKPPSPPVLPNAPVGSNAWLAVLMFLGAETMFFAGLIGA